MKVLKSYIGLTALVISFVFTNSALASESTTDESKENTASKTVGDAAPVAAKADTVVSEEQASQPQNIDQAQSYRKEIEERRRQVQQAQDEAYQRHLERRKEFFANNPAYGNQAYNNNIPADIQKRRNEYIKQMEERRALHVKMVEEHRKAAEERRKAMQLKMHQTNTAPEATDKA